MDYRNPDLLKLRDEMTKAEIGHLIGFFVVLIWAVYKSMTASLLLGLVVLLVNVLFNLYPVLLQQENKKKIDIILERYKGKRMDF